MRIAKIPSEVVCQQVWASLCERMDPETHLVRPQWKKMMREIGTSRQAISVAVNNLKATGKIETLDEKVRKGNRDWRDWWLVGRSKLRHSNLNEYLI